MRSRFALFLVAGLVITSGTGCKKLAEKIIKDKISAASDGGVTFNNDGTVTVKGNDTTTTGSSSGGSTTTSSFGSGAKLPEGWPDSIPTYPGAKVRSASSSGSDRTQTLSASMETTDSADAILKFYGDKITASGYKQSSTSESKSEYGTTKSVSFQKGKYGADGSVYLSVSPGFMDKSKLNISLSITSYKK